MVDKNNRNQCIITPAGYATHLTAGSCSVAFENIPTCKIFHALMVIICEHRRNIYIISQTISSHSNISFVRRKIWMAGTLLITLSDRACITVIVLKLSFLIEIDWKCTENAENYF